MLSGGTDTPRMQTAASLEPSKRSLHIDGLDPRITEEVLKSVFETAGHVRNVSIIPDANVSARTTAYASMAQDQPR